MEVSKQQTLSLMSELIKLARIDENLLDQEHEFLRIIATQIQLTDEEFEGLFERYHHFDPPKDDFNRILQFHRLVLLSNIDLHQDGKEISFIKEMGLKLGLNQFAIDEVLRRMEDFEHKIIPPEVLIEIFTRDFN